MITKELLEEAREHSTYDIPARTQQLLTIMADACEVLVPKKVLPDNKWFGIGVCPNCGATFINNTTKNCGNCGQALKWRE
ncbi:MAG: hypothetical protein IJN27_01775 [Oscillospiraceae bacterium]|nr:hypothetical protein [Oscillospiraceae bacterium]